MPFAYPTNGGGGTNATLGVSTQAVRQPLWYCLLNQFAIHANRRHIAMTIEQHTRLEHIEVQTPDGPARMHVLRRFDERNISDSHYRLDGWSAAPKSLLRSLLDAIKWNRPTARR